MNATNGKSKVSTHVPLHQFGNANSRRPLPQINKLHPKVTLEVGPLHGSKRLVIVRQGSQELYRDEVNVNAAKARERFLSALIVKFPKLAAQKEQLNDALTTQSDEIDQRIDECSTQEDLDRKDNRSIIDTAIAIAEKIPLFVSETEVACADITTTTGRITVSVTSQQFRGWLQQQVYVNHKTRILKNPLDSAIEHIELQAKLSGIKKRVFRRIASQREKIYIDLGRPDGKAVMITKKRSNWFCPRTCDSFGVRNPYLCLAR